MFAIKEVLIAPTAIEMRRLRMMSRSLELEAGSRVWTRAGGSGVAKLVFQKERPNEKSVCGASMSSETEEMPGKEGERRKIIGAEETNDSCKKKSGRTSKEENENMASRTGERKWA